MYSATVTSAWPMRGLSAKTPLKFGTTRCLSPNMFVSPGMPILYDLLNKLLRDTPQKANT